MRLARAGQCASFTEIPTEDPEVTGRALILRLWEEGADPNAGVDARGALAVYLFMPEHGHGSRPVAIERVAPGEYRVTEVFFIMPGNWEVRVRLTDDFGVFEETALAYRIP